MSGAMERPTSPVPYAPAAVPTMDVPSRVCLISVAGELFAVDLRHVREIFETDIITPVPGMPAVLTGVTNLRGTVVPIVDLRRVLQLPAAEPLPYAIALRHGPQLLAVMIDGVPEVRDVRGDDFLPAPATGSGGKPFVSAIVRVEDRIGGLVEVSTLLSYMDTVD
jgi:purine-binding chemotaxis protein CheW